MTFANLFTNDAEPLRNPTKVPARRCWSVRRPRSRRFVTMVATPIVLHTTYPRTVSLNRRATGRPVVALCGKVWVPKHDPSKYPVCPDCKRIYEEMTR